MLPAASSAARTAAPLALVAASLASLPLSGCGNRGELYLPSDVELVSELPAAGRDEAAGREVPPADGDVSPPRPLPGNGVSGFSPESGVGDGADDGAEDGDRDSDVDGDVNEEERPNGGARRGTAGTGDGEGGS